MVRRPAILRGNVRAAWRCPEGRSRRTGGGLRGVALSVPVAVLVLSLFEAFGQVMRLSRSGPAAVRELGVVEYQLELVNEGVTAVEMFRVLDGLLDGIEFAEAVRSPAAMTRLPGAGHCGSSAPAQKTARPHCRCDRAFSQRPWMW